MGLLTKTIMMLTLILMLSACVTTNFKIPDKYMLDNQLERVTEVSTTRLGTGKRPAFTYFEERYEDPLLIMNRRDTVTYREFEHWVKVDQQSLIMKSTSSDYYLLVFGQPATSLMGTNEISFTLRADILKAGGDFLVLDGQKYIIDRIYRIIDSEQMNAIENQIIRGNKE